MYSSRASNNNNNNNNYGQPPSQPMQPQTAKPYASQSSYRQNLASAYSASSVGGPDGSSQLSMASRHSSMLGGGGGSHEAADIGGGYGAHPSAATQYGGQYSSVYGSAALSSAQLPAQSSKGAAQNALENRRGYSSAMPESPKFASSDYVSSSSHMYSQKGDHLYVDKLSDYPSIDRRHYGERPIAYLGRELNEPAGRYGDSLGFAHQQQSDMYDRLDQASMLRKEQMMKVQSLQSSSLDGSSRQADYLVTRGAAIRHPAEDLMSYAGRVEADPRSLTGLSGSSHGGQQHAPSILGAAPRRTVDDLVFAQSSSNPGYGVSLPPGRDYATGKGLHGALLESDYPGSLLSRGSLPRMDDRKDERGVYARELDRREEERRRDLLREREKERERERKREKDRERERERERKRRKERITERREKEKEREIKHGSERTPPRPSRDRRGSSLLKEGRSLRRDSPRQEVLHRRQSPVKEKRREYACKVYSSSLVEVQRDYLSMDKRYPRLYVAPEVSKVVVNWPKGNIKLSLHTPVSFEHDFAENANTAEHTLLPPKSLDDGHKKSERGTTVWNAKMILMSGLSQNALEELSSDRSYDDRIPHYCNMLRFALIKKDNAFMAIGGRWDTIDGGDPSEDDSSLVRTVIRYAKAVSGLDLTSCQRWNRFLEIHYDRIGKDGLFSHKEVTVLYVPDLSDCLPSLEIWREQWLTHKKEVSEREHQLALKLKKRGEKKVSKDKNPESVKDPKNDAKLEKRKLNESLGEDKKEKDVNKKSKDGNTREKDGNKPIGTTARQVDDVKNKKIQEKVAFEIEEGKQLDKKEQDENPVQTSDGIKSGKKRIIKKKIVKQKVSNQNCVVENSTAPSEKLEDKDIGENNLNAEGTDQLANPSAVKNFIRKKVTKKVVKKNAQKGDEAVQAEVISVKEPEGSEGNVKGKSETGSAAELQDASVKTTVKKKIIKRVPKRKVSELGASDGAVETKDVNKDAAKSTQAENDTKTMVEQTTDASNQGKEVISENKVIPKKNSKQASEKQGHMGSLNKKVSKAVEGKNMKEQSSVSIKDASNDKQKDGHAGRNEKSNEREKSKEEKEIKDKDRKDEIRNKSNRDVKEKNKIEEPPRHPGLFLCTNGSKNMKLRSLSLSLDSLLDYTSKDVEESTFELSVFAEALYEMLQYQMGCRLLTFLQKLRIKFVVRRNKRKRQTEESTKNSELVSPVKRAKTEKPSVEDKLVKTETQDELPKDPVESAKTETNDRSQLNIVESVRAETNDGSQPDIEKTNDMEDGNSSMHEVMKVQSEEETDEEEEDPEEDPEEDEEMPDGSPHDSKNEEKEVVNNNAESAANTVKVPEDEKIENQEPANETPDAKPNLELKDKPEEAKTEKKKKETQAVVDKELLQAFRFFDRNRVGYIRVEDMRLIIHNLGKFMSHRDVKELVQSALLESNTGRNDQILYDKLVKMSGL